MNKDIRGHFASAGQLRDIYSQLKAATTFGTGAIIVDEFDRILFDDVYRKFILWNRIDKRLAPGETTGGFDQTGLASARVASRRNLSWNATAPTRVERTRREIKAIVADIEFGIFDLSVYQQQGRRFGNLEEKDVRDMATACMRLWSQKAYTGDSSVGDGEEFDGLRKLLGPGDTVQSTESVINAIQETIVAMVNNSDSEVMPTAIYTNAQVVFYIEQELLAIGNRLNYAPIQVGTGVFQVAQLSTPAGMLPLVADPFNSVIAGTPDTYPTFIVSEDKLSWQYVEVLGQPGAEPKTFDLGMENDLDHQYKTLMFGALELLGGTRHHARLNVKARSTVVPPVSTE